MLLLADNTGLILFALGMLLMVSILTRRSAGLFRKSRRSSPKKHVRQVRESADRALPRMDVPLVDAPAKYARWYAELNHVVRDAEAELETKIRRLQATIRLAQETTQRAEQAIQRLESLVNSVEPSDDAQGTPALNNERESYKDTAGDAASVLDLDPQQSTLIEELKDSGLKASEIAQRTGASVGDIELYLSLAQQSTARRSMPNREKTGEAS